MEVFISWSGSRSQQVAQILRDHIPMIVGRELTPWVSSEDIAMGTYWGEELTKALRTARFGIVCITPENQSEPWLLFEAGILAGRKGKPHTCPYLFDMKTSDLKPPLTSLLQAAVATKGETFKLVDAIVCALSNDSSKEQAGSYHKRQFDKWWPEMEKAFQAIPAPNAVAPKPRTEREMLEEMLPLVRRISAQPPRRTRLSASVRDALERIARGEPAKGTDSNIRNTATSKNSEGISPVDMDTCAACGDWSTASRYCHNCGEYRG